MKNKKQDKNKKKSTGLKVKQQHDGLFKEVLARPEQARSLLKKCGSEVLLKAINLDSLALDNTEYRDENFKTSFSDIVYNVEVVEKNKAKICFLFEHKSYVDKYIWPQLLTYIAKIMERALDNGDKLPLVIPIIVYHGKKEWKGRDLKEYWSKIYTKELTEWMLHIPKIDVDICSMDIQKKFADDPFLALSLVFMRIASLGKYTKEELVNITTYVKKISKKDILIAATYITYSLPAKEKNHFIKILNQSGEGGKLMYRTIADSIKDEGIQEGMQQGRQSTIDALVMQGIMTEEQADQFLHQHRN